MDTIYMEKNGGGQSRVWSRDGRYCLFSIYVLALVSSVYTAVIAVPCYTVVCIKIKIKAM